MPEKAGKTCVVLAALGYAVNPVKYGAGMGQPSLHSVGILHLKPSLSYNAAEKELGFYRNFFLLILH